MPHYIPPAQPGVRAWRLYVGYADAPPPEALDWQIRQYIFQV